MNTPSSIKDHNRGDYSAGLSTLQHGLSAAVGRSLMIREKLSGSEWAEKHGRLPKGTSADVGKIKLFGFQRGLMDLMCDSKHPKICVKKSTRVGYTRCLLLATGYFTEHEASNVAITQPTITDAEDFSRDEVQPMLTDTPVLADMIRVRAKGDSQDTVLTRKLTNGATIRIRGAASDDAFRRYTARVLMGDEVDAEGWIPGPKTQGSKLDLFWKRGETHWNRKMIIGSSPVLEDTSVICDAWDNSTQRHYHVPCPHCGEKNPLEWGGPDVPHGLKWSVKENGKLDEVWYVCKASGCVITEDHKVWMDDNGEWVAHGDPDAEWEGLYIWTAMSLFPNASWRHIVSDFLKACKNVQDLMQPFVNTTLGNGYTPLAAESVRFETFLQRKEPYPTEVPEGVGYLTFGGDVQPDRLEVSVYGWGDQGESWLVGHWVFSGDPDQRTVWDEAEALLDRPFIGPGGREFRIECGVWDSGGHNTQSVYTQCAIRKHWYAIKGRSENRGKRVRVWPKKPTRHKYGGDVYLVGGNAARDVAYRRLLVEQPGPGYVHFPATVPAGSQPLDDEFFRQLTAEKLVTKGSPATGRWTEWRKNVNQRKEAGVCYVYAYVATQARAMGRSKHMRQEAGQEPVASSSAPNGDKPVLSRRRTVRLAR